MLTGPGLTLLGLVAALGVPGVIAMKAPRRWRLRALLGWMLAPLGLTLLVLVVDSARNPLSPTDREKLVFALALIGSIAAVPWILTCLAGFAIGAAVRPQAAAVGSAARQTRATEQPITQSGISPAVMPADAAEDAFPHRRIAPDKSICVDLEMAEWSNSHWVCSPRVIEIATGRVLLGLWGSDWDVVVTFPRARTVALGFRRYHAGGALDAEIDLERGTYRIRERSGAESEGPLTELEAALNAASARATAEEARVAGASVRTAPFTNGRRWTVMLLILIGAFAAIAAATFVTQRMAPRPVQKLDRIPPMPGGATTRLPI